MIIINLILKIPKYLRHMLLWAFFIGHEVIATRLLTKEFPGWQIWVYYALNICLFYSWLYALKGTEKAKSIETSILKGTISFIILFGIYFALSLKAMDAIAYLKRVAFIEKEPIHYAQISWRALYFFTISTAVYLVGFTVRLIRKNAATEILALKTQNENQRLAHELTLAQNAYLQGQIDRHMMSNALHFAYEKVVRVSDTAAKAISLLSDIVDYGISLPKNDSAVSIDREIKQVNNLISLNRLRFGDKLHLNFDNQLSGDVSTIKILPYLLTTVTENIFQHGDFHNAEYPAIIALTNIGSELQIVAENKKRGISIRPGHGIGLENIKTRLNVHYGTDAYEMEIKEDPDFFRLRFKINL